VHGLAGEVPKPSISVGNFGRLSWPTALMTTLAVMDCVSPAAST
jgi:hypothetical protein